MTGIRPRRHHVLFSLSLGVDGEGTPYRAVWSENSADQYHGSTRIVVLFGNAPWDTNFFDLLAAIKVPWRYGPGDA